MASIAHTVSGPVNVGDLGPTLMHEHLFINLVAEYRGDGLLNDKTAMIAEIAQFQELGGKTIVDVTPRELSIGAFVLDETADLTTTDSRTVGNIKAVEAVASETGVQVVLGTSQYREPYISTRSRVDELSVNQIARSLIRDLEVGFPGTNVRAGIIGEVAVDKWYISAKEERSFRAAARAHKETGAPITTHAARWPVGLPQLDLLEEEGVDPRRVVIGHCDTVPDPNYYEELARRGAFVQFDMLRGVSAERDRRIAHLIVELARKGYHEKILLSHDVCTTSHLRSYGGQGFTYIGTTFSDYLITAGMTQSDIDLILEHNPARVFDSE